MGKLIISGLFFLFFSVGLMAQSMGEGNIFKYLTLSPNPTKGNTILNLGSEQQDVAVTINDITGRIVGKTQYFSGQFFPLTIDRPNGIYFVTVTIGNQKKVIRIIKS